MAEVSLSSRSTVQSFFNQVGVRDMGKDLALSCFIFLQDQKSSSFFEFVFTKIKIQVLFFKGSWNSRKVLVAWPGQLECPQEPVLSLRWMIDWKFSQAQSAMSGDLKAKPLIFTYPFRLILGFIFGF